jgi:hypothetical protein
VWDRVTPNPSPTPDVPGPGGVVRSVGALGRTLRVSARYQAWSGAARRAEMRHSRRFTARPASLFPRATAFFGTSDFSVPLTPLDVVPVPKKPNVPENTA